MASSSVRYTVVLCLVFCIALDLFTAVCYGVLSLHQPVENLDLKQYKQYTASIMRQRIGSLKTDHRDTVCVHMAANMYA